MTVQKRDSTIQAAANKPVILRNTANKVLVALLCAVSFIAGFYAHQTRQENACLKAGGTVQIHGQANVCIMK